MTPPPLSPVRVVMSKWGDRPHWEFDAVFLGSDEHGDWCGIPAGTHMSRPGAEYVAPVAQVGLSPAEDAVGGRWLARDVPRRRRPLLAEPGRPCRRTST